jgi:hypothetical protein
MEVGRDSEVPARLRGLKAQLLDSGARMKSMAYTVEDVVFGIIEGRRVEHETLVLVLHVLRHEQQVLETVVLSQVEPIERVMAARSRR